MHVPFAIDFASTPLTPGTTLLNAALLVCALLLALMFTCYLACCYLQEFRRERRVRRRKESCRATPRAHPFEPLVRDGLCHRTPPSADEEDRRIAAPLHKLDAWRLQWVIPQHDSVTLVWDTCDDQARSREPYDLRQTAPSHFRHKARRIAA